MKGVPDISFLPLLEHPGLGFEVLSEIDVTPMTPKERFTDSLHVAFDAGRRVK